MNERYRCTCGWEGTEDQMTPECLDAGDRYQPPEWTNRCPDCNKDWETMEEVPLCVSCEDTYVFEEGDRCGICVAEQAEEEACRGRGH